MAASSSSIGHLSVAMTTESVGDVTQTTRANVAMTSSSRGIEFYFQCAVVVIGVVGMASNALVLYAMVVSKQHKKHLLIFHQNVIDFITSLILVVTYSLKLGNIYLTGLSGYWLCMLLLNESLLWCAILASKINLMAITIERYLKVVHPTWSKKWLRGWVLYLAAAFAWISSVHMFGVMFATSAVVYGVCYGYAVWESRESALAHAIWYFLSFYVVVLIIFVFCYWRILIVVRRQANVMAGHSAAGPSTASAAVSHHIQTNVIKTMILVSVFYAISDTPIQIYSLLWSVTDLTLLDGGYFAALFIAFLYICTNPFIYATKFDPVKRVLLSLIPCKTTPVHPIESVEMNVLRAGSNRSGQSSK